MKPLIEDTFISLVASSRLERSVVQMDENTALLRPPGQQYDSPG